MDVNNSVHAEANTLRVEGDDTNVHECEADPLEKKPNPDEHMWDEHSLRKPLVERRKSAKMEDSLLGALCTWIVEHQLGEPKVSVEVQLH